MNAVSLEGVSKWYRHRPALFNLLGSERSGKTMALDQVSVRLQEGALVVLVGPNGSGKSTFLRLCSGHLLPDSGSITVFDRALHDRKARHKTAFVGTAERSLFGQLTTRENLEFFGAFDNLDAAYLTREIPRILTLVGLDEFADVRVAKLSSGNLQRLALARGLISDPQLLLLDEPSRSLDPDAVEHFWHLLEELRVGGHTIVMSSHNLDEAFALGDRIIGLKDGRICFDQAKRALSGSTELRRIYLAETKAHA